MEKVMNRMVSFVYPRIGVLRYPAVNIIVGSCVHSKAEFLRSLLYEAKLENIVYYDDASPLTAFTSCKEQKLQCLAITSQQSLRSPVFSHLVHHGVSIFFSISRLTRLTSDVRSSAANIFVADTPKTAFDMRILYQNQKVYSSLSQLKTMLNSRPTFTNIPSVITRFNRFDNIVTNIHPVLTDAY